MVARALAFKGENFEWGCSLGGSPEQHHMASIHCEVNKIHTW